jgi:hypothetical protein
MPPTNLIVNSTFDAGAANWSGNDIEAYGTETAYLGNGSNNRVAEMDGTGSQTTVMEQTFTVTNPTATELTFDSALRTDSNPQAGLEGFTVEILDSGGTVIATTTILPTDNSLTSFSLPVTFPTAGDYTVRLTEVGPDNGIGAIVDNIELLVCFHGSTAIRTPDGEKLARKIAVGDLVETERGPKPVRWVGRRSVSAHDSASNEKFLPVKITAGALGENRPKADLWVSRQHRILVSSPVCQRMFGDTDVLVAAIRLLDLPDVFVDRTMNELDYVHILFDEHEIVFAEGTPSESLLLNPEAKKAISPEAMEEILSLFPELKGGQKIIKPAKQIPENGKQVQLVSRLRKNNKAVLDSSEYTWNHC